MFQHIYLALISGLLLLLVIQFGIIIFNRLRPPTESPEWMVRKAERGLLKAVPRVPKTIPRSISLNSNPVLKQQLALSLRLILEEVKELQEAIEEKQTIDEILKEASDLYVVVVGLGSSCALPLAAATAVTSRSNLTKLASDGYPIYNEYGKYIKGPNYKKPDMADAYVLHQKFLDLGVVPSEDPVCIWSTPEEYADYVEALREKMTEARRGKTTPN